MTDEHDEVGPDGDLAIEFVKMVTTRWTDQGLPTLPLAWAMSWAATTIIRQHFGTDHAASVWRGLADELENRDIPEPPEPPVSH